MSAGDFSPSHQTGAAIGGMTSGHPFMRRDGPEMHDCCGSSWPGDNPAWYADASRLKALGFHARVSLEEGLKCVVADLNSRPLEKE